MVRTVRVEIIGQVEPCVREGKNSDGVVVVGATQSPERQHGRSL